MAGGRVGSSVDGRIVFTRQSVGRTSVLVTASPDGTHQRVVSTPRGKPGFGNADFAQWSPDGKMLLFEDDAASTHGPPGAWFHLDLYTVAAAGGLPTRLTTSGVNENGSWSANGRSIVFERSACDCAPTAPYVGHVAEMRADGSGVRNLTTSPWRCCDEDAEFSPDGRSIVFERTQNDDSRSALFVMSANGTGLRRITSWTSQAGQPDWSPDGKWILYNDGSGSAPGSQHLFLIRPDGTRRTPIPNGDGGAQPTWSPDGTRILFVRAGDLWVIGKDGSGTRRITRTPFAAEEDPDWGSAASAG